MSDSSSLSSLPPSPEAIIVSLPTTSRGLAQRTAARKASANVKEQIASDDDTSNDSSDDGSAFGENESRRGSRRMGGQVAAARHSLNTAHHRVGYGKASRRASGIGSRSSSKPQSNAHASAVVGSSPATVVASTPPAKTDRSHTTTMTSHHRSLFGSSPLSPPTPSPHTSPSKRRAGTAQADIPASPSKRPRTSSSMLLARTSSISAYGKTTSPKKSRSLDDTWNREALDGVVWVLLNKEGAPADDGDQPGTYWWPAKLTCESWNTPLMLDIIGDDGKTANRSMKLSNPSPANIQTFGNPVTSRPRFDVHSFHASSTLNDTPAYISQSARRLQQRLAAALLIAQTTHEQEDLPEIEDAVSGPLPRFPALDELIASSPSSAVAKRKGKKVAEEQEDSGSQETIWVDPGPDHTLDIPGELVLARDRSTQFWPAVIHAYIPPTATKGKGKFGRYRVEYVDRTFLTIKREEFFSQDDDGFVTCKLGQFTHDQDDEDATGDEAQSSRSSTPDPLPPPPTTLSAVENLAIADLLKYIRAILTWTIWSKYPPTLDRCQSFYRGGRQRKNLAAIGTEMGTLGSNERALVRSEVIRWAVGKPAAIVLEEKDLAEVQSSFSTDHDTVVGSSQPERDDSKQAQESTPPSSIIDRQPAHVVHIEDVAMRSLPVRPRGCAEYEALSDSERLQFCVDVLVPEAAAQLLAWQAGYRFDTPVPPPCTSPDAQLPADVIEQEISLHERASRLAAVPPPSEWVNKVMSIRSSRRAAMEERGLLPAANFLTPRRSTGTTTRPNAGRKLE